MMAYLATCSGKYSEDDCTVTVTVIFITASVVFHNMHHCLQR